LDLRAPTQTLRPGGWYVPGGPELEVLDLGHAHSENDVAVFLPAEGVLFAGDLAFFGVVPLLLPGEADVRAWLAALAALLRLDAAVAAPGPAPPGGRADSLAPRDSPDRLLDHARTCRAAGRTVAEAAATFVAGPAAAWVDQGRTATNLFTLYRDLAGAPAPRSADEIERVFSELVTPGGGAS